MITKLSKNLKWLREFYGFTQQQLAQVCFIDRSTFSYYESGKTEPSLRTLLILSRVLKVTLDDLVTADISASLKKKKERQHSKENDVFLSKSENEMLALFRALDENAQEDALKSIKGILAEYCKKLKDTTPPIN